MKRSLLSLALVAGACGILLAEKPSTPNTSFSKQKLELIERNLVNGLESGIPNLQSSSALVLRQVKSIAPEHEFSLCMIPLMRIVRATEYDVDARLAAGLALFDLKSACGDDAIAKTAKFENNQRIRRIFVAMAYERGLQKNLN